MKLLVILEFVIKSHFLSCHPKTPLKKGYLTAFTQTPIFFHQFILWKVYQLIYSFQHVSTNLIIFVKFWPRNAFYCSTECWFLTQCPIIVKPMEPLSHSENSFADYPLVCSLAYIGFGVVLARYIGFGVAA